MSDQSAGASTGEGEPPAFDEGRYLYCAVDTTGVEDATLDCTGVDGGAPYLLERDGVGLVVQACSSPYDSSDVATVKQWLLRHQAVIDEAGEEFGTPLPFRFDTVLKGDDDRVREWLADAADDIAAELGKFAGQWEYRIEVIHDRETLEDHVVSGDDRLAELQERRAAATDGTAFLLEKQVEQRVRGLTERRHAEDLESLADRLREVATTVQDVDRTVAGLDDDGRRAETEHRSMVAVLAPAEREADIGDRLDEFAARPGVEVRFTGPWPPYTFAPELGSGP